MRLVFPKSLALTNVNTILTDFSNYQSDEILIDLTELEYIDSGTANYAMLLPFYLRSANKKVKILINSKSDSYQFIKKIGIVEELEDNFEVSDSSTIPKLAQRTLQANTNKFQAQLFGALSANPFFKTFLASNDKNRNVLMKLSQQYKSFLATSPTNDFKISRCLIELIDNIFQHSEQNIGAISVHHILENKIPFLFVIVTDLGIGFKNSLLKSKRFKDATDLPDEEFIKAALGKQVSSTDNLSRGFGLPTVAKYCDKLSITSGLGNLTLSNDNSKFFNPQTTQLKEVLIGANIICILRLDDNSVIVNKSK
jgi:anti-sigma regulatory factor (Ser/Thr protein kinase)